VGQTCDFPFRCSSRAGSGYSGWLWGGRARGVAHLMARFGEERAVAVQAAAEGPVIAGVALPPRPGVLAWAPKNDQAWLRWILHRLIG